MATNYNQAGLSDLELELELEMDSPESESEAEDFEGLDGEADEEFELGADAELEFEGGPVGDQEYVERFMEIAAREFESESEIDHAMNEVLGNIETEYLFGSLKKWGKRLMKNKALGALVKRGLSVASGQFPALKAAMALASGNLKGTLLNLGKQALTTAIPGSGAALGALNSLGFKIGDGPEENREAWENYTQMSREAYETLAETVTPNAHQPVEASRLAANAFQRAYRRAQSRAMSSGKQSGAPMRGTGAGPVKRYHVAPGERVVISGVRKLVVKGG